jgi:hypothetical protein
MIVICKSDIPVAIKFKNENIIIPNDRQPHEVPDELFNQYNDLLFCVRPPIVKEEIKPIIPPKPLDNVRIDETIVQNKYAINTISKKQNPIKGKKRTWDIWKNRRDEVTGKLKENPREVNRKKREEKEKELDKVIEEKNKKVEENISKTESKT